MSYQITTIPKFDKQAKALAKKYPSFKSDLAETDRDEIVFLSIYDKSEHETITDKQIREALKSV